MPFKSEKQRAYLFSNKPDIAKRWANKYGTKINSEKTIGMAYMTKKKKK